MRAVDIIRKKRDGHTLHGPEIARMVEGLMRGEVADYQWSALLMAIVFRGMDAAETALTEAGLTHEMRVFDGVDHAFFNDTGPRYDADAAAEAYQAMLDWFGQHLAT